MANTAIIPLKAIRTGSQATGDVTALGEFESGDKISASYFSLSGVVTSTDFNAALANTNAYIATKAPTATPTFTGNATFDTDTLFVDSSNDRVGIGTTSPDSLMHLSSGSPIITLTDTGTGADHKINADSGAGNLAFDVDYNSDTASPSVVFNIKGTERMRIDTDGDVGIGGAAPSGYRFEVTQSTAADLLTRTYNSDTTSTSDIIHQYRVNNDAANIYIQFGDAASASAGGIRYNHADNSMRFTTNAIDNFRMEADGDLHANGDIVAYSTTVSDERLKDNIEIISNAADKVSRIKGVTFTRKGGDESAGIIAQDILNILPQAVKEKSLPLQTGTDDKYYVVEYDAVTGLLVQAVKELTERVQELEKNHYK